MDDTPDEILVLTWDLIDEVRCRCKHSSSAGRASSWRCPG